MSTQFSFTGSNTTNPNGGLNSQQGKVVGVLAPSNPNGTGTSASMLPAVHPTAPTAQPISHTVTTNPATGQTVTKQTFTPSAPQAGVSSPGMLAKTTPQVKSATASAPVAKPITPAAPIAPAKTVKNVQTSPDGKNTVTTYSDGTTSFNGTPAASAAPGVNQTPSSFNPDGTVSTYGNSLGVRESLKSNPPAGNTLSTQIPVYNQTGAQTPQEYDTQGNVISKSNTGNPIATTAGNNLNAISTQDSPAVLAAQADLKALQEKHANNTADIAGTAGFLTQQNGLQGNENSRYAGLLNASQTGLSNALTEQGQQIGASSAAGGIGNSMQGMQNTEANTAYAGAQTQAGRNTGVQGGILGAVSPQAYSLMSQPYNPGADTYGGGGTQGAIDRASQAGLIQQANTQGGEYQAGKVKLSIADGIQSQIIGTLKQFPELNNTPVSLLTNINELIAGQTSNPAQQQLAQQINSYIQTLGLDPAAVTNIAHQSQGTLAQLLDSLRSTAQITNDKKNPANIKNNSSDNGTAGSYTSNSGNTYKLPYN
jgi:hypothetical protein